MPAVRYLLASDLHYQLPQLDWIADQASGFDAVVLAGDHLDISGRVELAAQISMMSAYLARLCEETVVVVDSGNHDLSARGEHGEKIAAWLHELDDRVVTDGNTVHVGADLVSSCLWWEGPVTKAAVEDQLQRDADERPTEGHWIWVYHSPPDASPTSWSGSRHFGDDLLNQLIERHRPELVLTGHVHEAPMRPDGSWHDRIGDTLVLNAGRQPGPIPAHAIIDTDACDVLWWSFDGGEQHVPLRATDDGQ